MALTRAGIHYEASRGSGPTVVFLHGVTLDLGIWSAQVEEFGDRWRCIAVDLRGHGGSAPLEPGYDPTADLLGVVDEAGVDRCVLVGLSLGGYEAVVFAALHPDRCRGLVLADTWIPGPELAGWEPPYRLARQAGREAALEAWLADPLLASVGGGALGEVVRAMVATNDLRIWTERIPRAPGPGARELASLIRTPALVVVGKREIAGFRAVADWLAVTVPGVGGRPVAVVPGAGHLPPFEAHKCFNQVLEEFVLSLLGTPAG